MKNAMLLGTIQQYKNYLHEIKNQTNDKYRYI